EIGDGVEAAAAPPARDGGVRDVADIGAAGIQLRHLLGVDVEAQHGKAAAENGANQRQADIAQADDADGRLARDEAAMQRLDIDARRRRAGFLAWRRSLRSLHVPLHIRVVRRGVAYHGTRRRSSRPGAIADVESRGEQLLSRAEVDSVSPSQSAPIVIVGAGGFIGRALVARLAERGAAVTAVMRHAAAVPPGVTRHAIGDITGATDWAPLLRGARAVVHLASRAHAPLGADLGWIEGDAAAAAQLARDAGHAGVERLVLLSSIKVLGEATDGVPFRAGRPAAPGDTYGFAKWYIEEAMRHAGAATPALTVIRPPLVYGPGVTANFRALLRLVDRAPPLPFAS